MIVVSALIALGASAAYAGGWAVTTLDPVPTELKAGDTYRIGYTIRQHGETPFVGANTFIEIRSSTSAAERFTAKPDGPRGHYVAEVRFPDAGEWQWSVDQSPFAPQALGSVTVVAASSSPAPATPNSTLALLPWLGMATLLAVLLFVWRLAVYLRIGRRLATAGVVTTHG